MASSQEAAVDILPKNMFFTSLQPFPRRPHDANCMKEQGATKEESENSTATSLGFSLLTRATAQLPAVVPCCPSGDSGSPVVCLSGGL